ncbi:MAG: HD domain-containing protein [Holophaga sp.]|nr:HD domain-containing protein [Holophaga sp.]
MTLPALPFPWMAPLVARLRLRFAEEARDGAHDLSHALRVAHNAYLLALEAQADSECCVAAALLHDLVYLPKNHPDSPRTGALGAELARTWCLEIPELAAKAEAIVAAIATHSFSSGAQAVSLEGAVLQDADRLEAIGAIGLARCFATGGAMGAALWHAEDPWGANRALDDKRFSLDHFELKLLKLAAAMNTEAGRRLAEARHRVLTTFLAALREEL